MQAERLLITEIEPRATGSDNGHFYLKGRTTLAACGECDVYLLGETPEQEHGLRGHAAAVSLTILCDKVEFV